MTGPPYQAYYDYLAEHVIAPFYHKRFADLQALNLGRVLGRKNPYLFKAKNIELAGDLVKGIVDAHLSSQEETIFGNLLEGFAIFVSARLDRGFKSSRRGLDLEFGRDGKHYLVEIKSGPDWGNSSQIARMKDNFKAAISALRTEGVTGEIIAVNGCIYGRDRRPLKPDPDPDRIYFKYCGQDFWEFISKDPELYREIIAPIDQEAKQKDENFRQAYHAKVNEMTEEFMKNFMTSHQIDWVKLIDFVSRRS